MSKHTEEVYSCDLCSKKLDGHKSLNIVTEIRDDTYWERLHLRVINQSGVHNDSDDREADLCKKCAVRLLTDALKRVKAGERATAGTESSNQEGWKAI